MSSTIAPTFPLQNGTLVATATQLHIADADRSSKKWLHIGSVTFALLNFALSLYRSLAENQQNPFLITVNVVLFLLGLTAFYVTVICKSYAGIIQYNNIKSYTQR